jgi:hypothetical protein
MLVGRIGCAPTPASTGGFEPWPLVPPFLSREARGDPARHVRRGRLGTARGGSGWKWTASAFTCRPPGCPPTCCPIRLAISILPSSGCACWWMSTAHLAGPVCDGGPCELASCQPASRRLSAVRRRRSRLCAAQALGRCRGGRNGLTRTAQDARGQPGSIGTACQGSVGPERAERRQYPECVGADRRRARPEDAAAAVSGEPGAVSRGGAVDRAAREPGQPRGPVCRLEHAQRRAGDAARRSHRPGRTGDPGAAAHAGARLAVLADLPQDGVLLAWAALGRGPLVWRP